MEIGAKGACSLGARFAACGPLAEEGRNERSEKSSDRLKRRLVTVLCC
jgi:hypothetical protein